MTNNVSFGSFKPANADEIQRMKTAIKKLQQRILENRNNFIKKYTEATKNKEIIRAVCETHLYAEKLIKTTFALERDNIIRENSKNVYRSDSSAFSRATKKLKKILIKQKDSNALQIVKMEKDIDGQKTSFNFISLAAEILFKSDLDPKDEAKIARYINAIRQSADKAFNPSFIEKIKRFFGLN